MSTKTNVALAAAALSAVALVTYQFQINRELEVELASAQKPAAKPKPPTNAPPRNAVITEDTAGQQYALSVLRPPGIPTMLRKVGTKFYPLTVDDIRQDPELMNQLTSQVRDNSGVLSVMQKQFGLSDDQTDSLDKIIADRNAQTFLLYLQFSQPDLTDADFALFEKQRLAFYDEADTEVSAIINNADNFARYQAYMNESLIDLQHEFRPQDANTEPPLILSFKSRLRNAADDGSLALSPEQNDALLNILDEESAAAYARLPGPFVVRLMQATGTNEDTITQIIQEMESRIQTRVAQILSPTQIAVFDRSSLSILLLPKLTNSIAHYLNQSIAPALPEPSNNIVKTGQLVIFPAGNGGSAGSTPSGGPAFSYAVKTLTASQ